MWPRSGKNLGNGLWKTSWTHLFPAKPDPWWSPAINLASKHRSTVSTTTWCSSMEDVARGRLGRRGRQRFDYIDYSSGQVYIGIDPTNRLMEITAFDVAIDRTTGECHGKTSDHKGPVIRGITFTQYAYELQRYSATSLVLPRVRPYRHAPEYKRESAGKYPIDDCKWCARCTDRSARLQRAELVPHCR